VLSRPPSVPLFVATQPVDGRKGPDSLMALVHTRSVWWPEIDFVMIPSTSIAIPREGLSRG